eukprot:TRINITY_DN17638_c0_g1_i1.p1 TRINITY_DN17638_c0_g1~~TRINITY_DN17638_c0_g1_i1.p1  ORF type:complete len:153 (-),score=53.58 TRINITY_DN17638_c0_g1_i1:119-577(-)
MKLKLSFSKLRSKLVDTEEQRELRGTSGRYKLIEKSAPLAVQENDAKFRSFPDFTFLHVQGNAEYCETESRFEEHSDHGRQINFFTEVTPLKDTAESDEDDDDLVVRCRTKARRMLAKDQNLEEVLNKGERARAKRNIWTFTGSDVRWTRLG